MPDPIIYRVSTKGVDHFQVLLTIYNTFVKLVCLLSGSYRAVIILNPTGCGRLFGMP